MIVFTATRSSGVLSTPTFHGKFTCLPLKGNLRSGIEIFNSSLIQLVSKNKMKPLSPLYLGINFTSSSAKFWQFFLVEQKTRQECWGITSKTSVNNWSGSCCNNSLLWPYKKKYKKLSIQTQCLFILSFQKTFLFRSSAPAFYIL